MTMRHPITSRKKAQALSTALFLVGLAIILLYDMWIWPGIMLVIGLPLALRHFLLDRTYDMIVTLLIFVGTFVTIQFDISWKGFLPVICILGAIYILFREFAGPDDTTEDEKEEEINHELEEK